LFLLAIPSLTVGKYEQSFPTGSRTVARKGASYLRVIRDQFDEVTGKGILTRSRLTMLSSSSTADLYAWPAIALCGIEELGTSNQSAVVMKVEEDTHI
jgi:hypothetical protein